MTTDNQKTKDHFEALARTRAAGVKEGSRDWGKTYTRNLCAVAMEREPKRKLTTDAEIVRHAVNIANLTADQGEPGWAKAYESALVKTRSENAALSTPPTPPAAASPSRVVPTTQRTGPTTQELRERLAILEAAGKNAAPDRRTGSAVPAALAEALSTLRDFSIRASDHDRYQGAYMVFMKHGPMRMTGGNALTHAIADACNKPSDIANAKVRQAADAIVRARGGDEGRAA